MTEEQKNLPSTVSEVRKLAAIMFTDIKDFSKKMQKDEAATMRMLKTHNQMMTETVTKYSGSVIKTIGDAFLVSFDSVINATLCATEVQQDFYKYNGQVQTEDEKITVRIGVHLGDVIMKDKDVFGDGVNIASRIQSIAEVGGVNISESVYQQVRNKINIRVLNLGVPQLKGIDQPIRIYQVIIVPTDKARGALATNIYVLKTILKRKKTKRVFAYSAGAIGLGVVAWFYLLAPVPLQNSLAVLPFKNIGDATNEYVASGFSEDIITYVSKIPEVRVLSEAATREFKNSDLSEKDIAKKLGVRYLLTGSIEIQSTGITVRYRLTEPANNIDALNQNVTKPREEIFTIQQGIFRDIALYFQAAVATSGSGHISMEAYENYFRGLEYDRKERKEDNQIAISYLKRAVDKDSNFALGYIKLASSQLLNYERNWDKSEKWLIEAEGNIRKSQSIDSSTAEVFWLLGRLSIARGNHEQGMTYLERSIHINPNFARSYNILGREYLSNLSDPAKAITYWSKESELEPTNYNNFMNLGIAYAYLKQYPEAIQSIRRAVLINPRHENPWINLGVLYERTSTYDSAIQAYRNALQLNPKSGPATEYLSVLLLMKNQTAQSESLLIAGLRNDPVNYNYLYLLGVTKYRKGQKDSANVVWKDGARLADAATLVNPNVAEPYKYVALFTARLGLPDSAIEHAKHAVAIDSSEDNLMTMARVFAIIGKKQEMVEWFKRARAKNSDYDASFLTTDIDFEKYRQDEDLLLAARQ